MGFSVEMEVTFGNKQKMALFRSLFSGLNTYGMPQDELEALIIKFEIAGIDARDFFTDYEDRYDFSVIPENGVTAHFTIEISSPCSFQEHFGKVLRAMGCGNAIFLGYDGMYYLMILNEADIQEVYVTGNDESIDMLIESDNDSGKADPFPLFKKLYLERKLD
jgi:hypothetical protein